MLKEKLLRDIDSLPESRLETLMDFVQFLQFMEQQDSNNLKETVSLTRVAGLDVGTTWVSDDFDDPLPDSFWLGNAGEHESTA